MTLKPMFLVQTSILIICLLIPSPSDLKSPAVRVASPAPTQLYLHDSLTLLSPQSRVTTVSQVLIPSRWER